MSYVITSRCIDIMDRSCVDECPVDCIYVGERKLYINPQECIDCGACEPACPVEAIELDRAVPDDEIDFIEVNREFFTVTLPGRDAPIGAPGGARVTGDIGVDTPSVAAHVPAEQ